MDLNYILKREQISLDRAASSKSQSARAVHRDFAKAYGKLLATSSFPHNALQTEGERLVLRNRRMTTERAAESWENEGGAGKAPRVPNVL